jgi:hypothetical protein
MELQETKQRKLIAKKASFQGNPQLGLVSDALQNALKKKLWQDHPIPIKSTKLDWEDCYRYNSGIERSGVKIKSGTENKLDQLIHKINLYKEQINF